MGRSSGYRATEANRAEVEALRARLAACRGHEWQRAGAIMQQIVRLVGGRVGRWARVWSPGRCRYCDFYGHTRQRCQVRARDEAARDSRNTEKELCRLGAVADSLQELPDLEWSTWCAWADARYEAACDAGLGCRQGDHACGACGDCAAWREFMREWGRTHTEPRSAFREGRAP